MEEKRYHYRVDVRKKKKKETNLIYEKKKKKKSGNVYFNEKILLPRRITWGRTWS